MPQCAIAKAVLNLRSMWVTATTPILHTLTEPTATVAEFKDSKRSLFVKAMQNTTKLKTVKIIRKN